MKFQRKPIIIEANQFHPEGLPWPKGVVKINGNFTIAGSYTVVKPGDWIIDNAGTYYPCDPETFKMKFVKV